MAQITTSKRYRLNWHDIGKGLIVAVGSSVVVACQTAINTETLHFNWKYVVGSGIAGGFAYLAKNFFTPSQIVITEETKTE